MPGLQRGALLGRPRAWKIRGGHCVDEGSQERKSTAQDTRVDFFAAEPHQGVRPLCCSMPGRWDACTCARKPTHLVHIEVHKQHLPNARIALGSARSNSLVVEDAPAWWWWRWGEGAQSKTAVSRGVSGGICPKAGGEDKDTTCKDGHAPAAKHAGSAAWPRCSAQHHCHSLLAPQLT